MNQLERSSGEFSLGAFLKIRVKSRGKKRMHEKGKIIVVSKLPGRIEIKAYRQ